MEFEEGGSICKRTGGEKEVRIEEEKSIEKAKGKSGRNRQQMQREKGEGKKRGETK